MPEVTSLTDDQLLLEWSETVPITISLTPDGSPPRYSDEHLQRHGAVETELRRRGFVPTDDGWWEKARDGATSEG